MRKEKKLDKITGVVCAMSDNGWMNEDLTLYWLRNIWGRLSFSRRLLVWDAFRCHIMDTVKQKLRKMNTDTAVIPGGCIGLVQAADVSWNKPFKSAVRTQYEGWLAQEDKPLTKGGNPKAPSKVTVAHCIKNVWEALKPEVIQKSFKVCGITNNPDNSEDHLINITELFQKLSLLWENGGDLSKLDSTDEDTDEYSNGDLVLEDDSDDECASKELSC